MGVFYGWAEMKKKTWKRPPQKRFNGDKFRELAEIFLKARPDFDARTLMHALWQCEQTAYLKLGITITGVIWVRGDDFPIPCRSKKEVEALRKAMGCS
jgi:hypothetical protein